MGRALNFVKMKEIWKAVQKLSCEQKSAAIESGRRNGLRTSTKT